ncbi:MAG: MFS transporter, partial [Gammaproteobacteria bacterium]|nr:MFS transporter [Gammaproteobacteria bacterium]
IPAYLADVFGTRHVGAIHGRLLTAWSTAGVLGPLAITSFRKDAINDAIHELAKKVDPSRFKEQYGVSIDHLQELIQSKTVTISNLLEISPIGTLDPTPSVYNSVMYVMAALLLVALISNALMRPVHSKHHYKSS